MPPLDLAKLGALFSLPDAVVLIVDDAPENLRLLRSILSIVGCKVLEASSAEEARHRLLTTLPDVILMDVVMPGVDGYTLCQQIKSISRLAHIPVIFLSGLSDPMDKLKAFNVGGADFVSKPFDPTEVLARVSHQHKMLRMRQSLESEKQLLAKMNADLQVARQETVDVFGVMADQMRGQILDGKYLLEEKIGAGGFAVVYKARHLALQRLVAVKVLRPTNAERAARRLQRFRLEAATASRIRHRNATTVIDAATSSEGLTYLVMELLDGYPLNEELRKHGPLSLSRCLQLIMPVCEVLAEAHAVGVVHRDIKPANIFLHHERGVEIVKVLDFGIAKLIDASEMTGPAATLPGEMVGTVYYMSPEQISGDPCDGRTDVYSAGIMLYEMLTGQVPFPGLGEASIAAMVSHLNNPPVPPSVRSAAIPEAIDAVVLAALTKDPAQRPTILEFAESLLQVCRELFGDEEVDCLLAPPRD